MQLLIYENNTEMREGDGTRRANTFNCPSLLAQEY
jgi:hypothetical protein